MAEKELKKLNRKELLEMLIVQGRELDELQAVAEKQKKQLSERNMQMENIGTLSEAMLVLNGVFKSADAAAQQYLENISEYQTEKQAEADEIVARARREAAAILAAAEEERGKKLSEIDRMLEKTREQVENFRLAHPECHISLPFDDVENE